MYGIFHYVQSPKIIDSCCSSSRYYNTNIRNSDCVMHRRKFVDLHNFYYISFTAVILFMSPFTHDDDIIYIYISIWTSQKYYIIKGRKRTTHSYFFMSHNQKDIKYFSYALFPKKVYIDLNMSTIPNWNFTSAQNRYTNITICNIVHK